MKLTAGLKGEARLVVGDADTARALGSGAVEVLGTPRLVALLEEATIDAVDRFLDAGSTTVGMRVQVDHLHPTPVGAEVLAEAYLDKIDGRRITVTFLEGYPFAQVYAPPGQDLICFEPMTAPGNALISHDGLRLVPPGEPFTAAFRITVDG